MKRAPYDPANDLARMGPDGRVRVDWWGLVRRRAGATPDAQALVDQRGRRLTWGRLAPLAERVAAGLWSRGCRPGDTVSWQLPTSLESAVLLAALARLRVRQNPVIPLLRRAELEVIQAELNPELWIVPEVWNGFAHGDLARSLSDRVLALDLPSEKLGLPQDDPAVLPPTPTETDGIDEERWVFYTSGTTGVPKGARHTDGSVIAASHTFVVHSRQRSHDVVGMTYPITHIGGPGMIAATMRSGASTMCVERWDPQRTPFDLARERVNLLGSAPPHFTAYLAAQEAHGEEPLFPPDTMTSNGGAQLSRTMRDRLRETIARDGAHNSYGLTEFPMSCIAPRYDAFGRGQHPGHVGLPTPGVVVRIVDVATEQECPPGVEGEIRLAGPPAMLGYVDSRHDAAVFDDRHFIRSGDLGRLEPDGSLVVTGRLKDIITRNAENISAVEVEAALVSHPSIAEAAAVGIPDEHTGERCCAFLVVAPGARPPTLADIGAHFAARDIARFKTPERLEFVDALPRNAMGKVLKQQLRRSVTA
jgi:acyl-coenzyme A synthetase/AMP-(fatty) acid ligase